MLTACILLRDVLLPHMGPSLPQLDHSASFAWLPRGPESENKGTCVLRKGGLFKRLAQQRAEI